MMNDSLKKDFINFETVYFRSNLNNNNFYSLLDDSRVNIFIISSLKEKHLHDPMLDKKFKKNINELSGLFLIEKIDFSVFVHFKCEKDILYGYMLLFLLKVFSLRIKNSKFHKIETEKFSIKDFFADRNDFINTFSEYLFKLFLFNEIIYDKNFLFNKNFLRIFSFRFIELCVKKEFVSLKDIKTLKRHYKILKFNLFFVPFIPEIIFYTEQFNIYIRFEIDPYIYNVHFSSIFSVMKQATYSNSTFKIPSDQLNVLTQRNVYIDKNLLLISYNLLLENYKLKTSTDLLDLLSKISLKITNFIIEGDLESLKIYHSRLNEILTLIRIQTVLNGDFENKKLFLPFMLCFRGRVYELGNLSFTFYKEFRFCMYSGIYDKEVEIFHPINSQINNTIDEQFHFLKNYDWFSKLTLIRKRSCIWLFISLGVMKKTELGKKVHISSFLLKGLEMWDTRMENHFTDIFQKIEWNYLLFLIDELISSKILKKWIFWKDATASCFQHLLLILGERDENSYKICNLNSTEYWYDPYSYLISDFFEKRKDSLKSLNLSNEKLLLDESKFFFIFSRKRLKKVIMTESYGAGFKKLSSYFYLDLDLNEFSLTEQKEIKEAWGEFFNYLSNENVLFAQSSKAINKSFADNNLTIVSNPDGTKVDYSCFIIQITQNEIYIDKQRHTYQTRSITTNFDNEQFNTSLRANFVQSRDAVLARKYIIYTKMWTVHDCFSIDILNITYMIAVINELMNGEFFDLKINIKDKKIIYSIFIIL